MTRAVLWVTFFVGNIFTMMAGSATGDEKLARPIGQPGLVRDLLLLRKTTVLPTKPPVQGSSAEAIEAAERVFTRLKFVDMSKEHVLWILGDPRTVSDYGREMDQRPMHL